MVLKENKISILIRKLQRYLLLGVLSTLLTAVLGLVLPALSQNNERIDSLTGVLPTVSGEAKFEILRELFSLYNSVDYNKSYDISRIAIATAQEANDSLLIIRSYRMNGYALMNLTKNEDAVEILQKALELAENGKSNSRINEQIKYILNSIALAYTDIGNYPKALEYHFRSLVIREEEKNKLDESISLNNIGLVYYRMQDYEKAIEFYQKCLAIKKEIDDRVDNDRLLINMALCLISIDQYAKAISYINDALVFCGDQCNEEIRREALNSLGIAYFQTNELEKAKDSFTKSLAISKSQNNIPFIALNLIYLNKIDQRDNNGKLAQSYLIQAEKIIEGSGYVKVELELYDAFSEFYKAKNDFVKSLEYTNKYILLYKRIYNETMLRNLSQAENNYAERENLKTIQEKDLKLELKQALIDKQNSQYFFIIAIAILVLMLAIVSLMATRKQQRASSEIAKAKFVIEEKNQQLATQNKELDRRVRERTADLLKSTLMLTQVNKELDNFLYKSSHDIRGPLMTFQGLCNLGLMESNDSVVRNILEKLLSHSDKMAKILGRLTTVGKINEAKIVPDVIDFTRVLEEIIKAKEKTSKEKGVDVAFEIEDDDGKTVSDRFLLEVVLENLIDNGIKFYNSSIRVRPFVKVNIIQMPTQTIIKVEDNGIGIVDVPSDTMFHMFMRASERSETGGVGLYLAKVCTDKLGGEIKMEKSTKDGTIFTVVLPSDISSIIAKRKELEADLWRLEQEALEDSKKMKTSI